MTETKKKQPSSLREPKPKKKLGLVVPPALQMPHDSLILVASQQATPDSHISIPDSQSASVDSQLAVLASQGAGEQGSQLANKKLSAQTLYEQNLKSRQGKKQWNHRIDADLYDKVVEVAELLGCDLKEINQQALEDVVVKYLGKPLASQLPNSPVSPLIELTKLELLNYYSLITGKRKRVSTKERQLFDRAYAAYSPLLFELGLRAAKAYASEKGNEVYSFTFCSNAMQFRSTWPESAIIEELQKMREAENG